MDRGWVKSYRKIEDWEWYKVPNTAHLFQHLIRRANRAAKKWQGYEIPAGCLVTSVPNLSAQTGLSEMQIKTALKHLYTSKDVEKVTDEITDGKKANFTVLKVNNYSIYQDDNRQSNRRATDEQPTDNRPITANKNIRSKEVKNNKKSVSIKEVNKEKDISKEIEKFDPVSVFASRYPNPDVQNAFKEFLFVRKKKKKPVQTPRALNELMNKLDKLAQTDAERIRIIDHAALHQWDTFYPVKEETYRPAQNVDWSFIDGGDKGNVG